MPVVGVAVLGTERPIIVDRVFDATPDCPTNSTGFILVHGTCDEVCHIIPNICESGAACCINEDTIKRIANPAANGSVNWDACAIKVSARRPNNRAIIARPVYVTFDADDKLAILNIIARVTTADDTAIIGTYRKIGGTRGRKQSSARSTPLVTGLSADVEARPGENRRWGRCVRRRPFGIRKVGSESRQRQSTKYGSSK